MNTVKYTSKDDTYVVRRRFKRTLLYKLIRLIVSLILFVVSFCLSVSFNVEDGIISYHELGKTDYTVKLLPNDKYGAVTLPSGDNKAYVSSIIEKVNPSFNYELHLDKNINIKYDYKLTSTLYIYDYNSSKVLRETTELLSEDKSGTFDKQYALNLTPNIDYQKYANEVKSFKNDMKLPVTSKLVVKLLLKVNGNSDSFTDIVEKNITEQVTIPIGESTTDIKIDSKDINNKDQLVNKVKFKIKNVVFFVISLYMLGYSLFALIMVVIKVHVLSTKNIYNNTLNKILKNYDKVIVSGRIEINEDNYDSIIYPNKFEEMVDASINENSPILFYEVIPNEKSFFIIAKDKTLYKYRLSKVELEGAKK